MDEELLDGLFRRYSRSVFRRAGAILGDGDAAKDVMQEVFLRAIGGHAELSRAQSPLAWLYRVTTNICLNRLRDRDRQRRILRLAVPSAGTSTEPPANTALTVHAILRQVPEELQEIAVCYFIDKMSQDEIADVLGLPRRTVGYRLEQFRTQVREIFARPELA